MCMTLRLARKADPKMADAAADRLETVAWLSQVINYVDQQRETTVIFPRPFLDAETTHIAALAG